jgi:5-formyltetrahydrofolate cyclo-ligase
MEKQELRSNIKRNLRLLPPALFHTEGLNAAAVLQNHSLFNHYSTVLIFLSINNEIDTMPLIQAALACGKKVFVPRVEGDTIRFYQIVSAAGPWQTGSFGIREPIPGNSGKPSGEPGRPLHEEEFPALVIVPGLAFTNQGKRLGRGGGFYDRFLADLDTANHSYTTIGLCMTEQVIDDLPTDAWDRKMEGILTGEGFIQCENHQGGEDV